MLEQYIANNYARAGTILIGVFIILKILIWIIEKIVLKLTLKTETDLDDLIVKKTSKPLTLLVFFIGIRIALEELTLTETLMKNLTGVIITFIIITLSYSIFVVINLIFLRGWSKLAKKTEVEIDNSLTHLLSGFVKVVWIVLTLIYILHYWGIQIGPFLAGLGIGGIALALALQSSLSNIFSGISIILDKTIKVDDMIYLDDKTNGKVLSIGLRSTRIKTIDNEIIIVPNSKIADSKIQNVTLPDPSLRITIPFSVAYGTNTEKVKKIVLEEIKKIKGISKEKEIAIIFSEMGESSLNFKAYFHITSFENKVSAIDEANTKIYNALTKAKIEIPYPHIDVSLKKR